MKQQHDASTLAERIRAVLPDGHASEMRMFGGTTFLVNGNMLCCAFERRGLMLRVGSDAEAAALAQPFVRRLSETRKMPGFVFVEPGGIADETALAHWVSLARTYVDKLPEKPVTPKAVKAKAAAAKTVKHRSVAPKPAKAETVKTKTAAAKPIKPPR